MEPNWEAALYPLNGQRYTQLMDSIIPNWWQRYTQQMDSIIPN